MVEINGEYYCEYCFEPMTDRMTCCPKCSSRYDPTKYHGALTVGTVLAGKYFVGRVIGQGGFGITYLCYSTVFRKKVAIKEYFPGAYADRALGQKTVSPNNDRLYEKGANAFYREASLLSKFNHVPGIVKVEKFFRENNTVYFMMEYLDGEDLECYFAREAVPDENYVIFIATEVLKSLTVLHAENILHRDISPDNIFICKNGDVKLIDFGAARQKVAGQSSNLSVILKPGFAPLEQYSKKGNQGPWTDIYALGATIYFLLKRQKLPGAADRMDSDELDMAGLSPELAMVLDKMLALRIEDRYQTARETKDALERVLMQNANRGGGQNTQSAKKDDQTAVQSMQTEPSQQVGQSLGFGKSRRVAQSEQIAQSQQIMQSQQNAQSQQIGASEQVGGGGQGQAYPYFEVNVPQKKKLTPSEIALIVCAAAAGVGIAVIVAVLLLL